MSTLDILALTKLKVKLAKEAEQMQSNVMAGHYDLIGYKETTAQFRAYGMIIALCDEVEREIERGDE